MKLCPRCAGHRLDQAWLCAECGFSPPRLHGFPCFAPALALENDGMDAAQHDALDRLQQHSFWFRARNRLVTDLIRRHAPGARRVLELGCGTGFVTQALHQALPAAIISATEIYANGLAHAARRIRGAVELLQVDARQIPFRAEFDLVCAFDVLEHITEDEATLAEIASTLQPGGRMLLSVPQHMLLWSAVDSYSHHKRRYARGELVRKCAAVGLRVERSTSFVASLVPLMLASRLRQRGAASVRPAREHSLPRALDRSLEWVLDQERRLIGTGLSLPFGGSRFVVASRAN